MNRSPEHEARTWLGMAESMLQRMDFAKAEKSLRKAIEIAPKFPEAWIKLGDFLVSQNRIEEARSAYYNAAELDHELDIANFDLKLSGKSIEVDVHASDLLFEGVQAMFEKQLYKARKRFESATKKNPEHAAAWRLLGNVRVLQGDEKGAKKAHQRAGKLEPWSIKEYQLDEELSRPADENSILDHTDLMIRLMMSEPFEMLDSLEEKKERLEDATLVLELALEEDPFQQEKWREYGAVLMLQKRYEDAAKAFGRSLELNINDHECDFDYTIALYRYGVNNWRYVTEAEAMAFMIAKDSIKNKFISKLYKNYFSGFRDPDYYI
ncbi:MAG: tetratricopeptide repeat protein [Candidatus Thorarchaeota archaeon]|jgi:cytochrome c-type biogenesis protein CcmH/NrfG